MGLSENTRTILGGDITEEEYQSGDYDQYQQPFVCQDNVYYIKNNKALYKYVQNGEDILLVTLQDNQYYMTGLCSSDGKVYYTYFEKNGEEFRDEYICEYRNGESSDAVLLQNDCNYISGIIGNTVFYKTEPDDQFYKTFRMTDVR